MVRYGDRIVINPEIMAGRPVVKGTQIPVELVLQRLSQDLNLETLFAAYPHLTLEDVKASLAYAEALVEGGATHLLVQPLERQPTTRYPLHNVPIVYINPTDPVAEHDWEVLQ
jgi:uncharacterized protein (DUF433 family)